MEKAGDVLERAAGLMETGEKMVQTQRADEAARMFSCAMEELLDQAKVDIDLDRLLVYHFTAATYAKRYRVVLKQGDTKQVSLAEILSSNPNQGS